MAEEKQVDLIALTPINHRGRVLEVGEDFTHTKEHADVLVRAKEAAPPGDKSAKKAVAALKKRQAEQKTAEEEEELTEAQASQLSKFNDAKADVAIAMIEAETDEEMLLAMAAIEQGKAAGSRKSVLEAFGKKGIEV